MPRSKPADEAAVARGEVLFNDPTLACATCHSGEKLTNGETMDVGTGKPFQAPSLRGLAARAPYMHDGCAATLHDRFGPCGGGDQHGVTSALTPAQIDDLVAYLETL
ncbi:c-type cytochrome [Sorangium sp. So ce269]